MEEIRFNPSNKLKNTLKYELFKSITLNSSVTLFKSIKNIQYYIFSLEYTKLYPKLENLSININLCDNKTAIKDFSDCLSKLNQISQLNLNLNSNNIGAKGTIDLSNCFSNLSHISHLNLNDNRIVDNSIKYLSKCLSIKKDL